MYHLRFMGPHYQMGEKRGRNFKRAHITFPLHLDGFQLEHGRKSEEILRDLFPEVCREIEGVCDTVGVEYMPFVAWMLCMGCCMYNLRENIPVEVRGCTAFSVARGDRTFYGRNKMTYRRISETAAKVSFTLPKAEIAFCSTRLPS